MIIVPKFEIGVSSFSMVSFVFHVCKTKSRSGGSRGRSFEPRRPSHPNDCRVDVQIVHHPSDAYMCSKVLDSGRHNTSDATSASRS